MMAGRAARALLRVDFPHPTPRGAANRVRRAAPGRGAAGRNNVWRAPRVCSLRSAGPSAQEQPHASSIAHLLVGKGGGLGHRVGLCSLLVSAQRPLLAAVQEGLLKLGRRMGQSTAARQLTLRPLSGKYSSLNLSSGSKASAILLCHSPWLCAGRDALILRWSAVRRWRAIAHRSAQACQEAKGRQRARVHCPKRGPHGKELH